MADSVEFSLHGANEIIVKLNSLKDMLGVKHTSNVLLTSLRKAARVIARKVRNNAKSLDDPKTAEAIYKNVAVQQMKHPEKKGGDIGFRVGIRGGARNMMKYGEFYGKGADNPGGDTWHWRLLEFGTEHSAAKPFMRPALENGTMEATNTFIEELDKQIDKAIARYK